MLIDNHLRMDGGEYRSPLCKVIQVKSQGIICTSDGPTEKVDETEGEW